MHLDDPPGTGCTAAEHPGTVTVTMRDNVHNNSEAEGDRERKKCTERGRGSENEEETVGAVRPDSAEFSSAAAAQERCGKFRSSFTCGPSPPSSHSSTLYLN
ncbi:unnamed protein product [Pleuronectes platessa]|uniref:Uncharacterized protein n=1 Tax=Pleuronectes platessa TaxID=8262 RepID=A0A9N7ULC0_PLEPL|nr:unnamed protein product [Pleuronectes platessa]